MAARTSHLIHQPVVSDEDCLKYRGQWVAVAMTDGRILASGNTVLEVAKVVDDLGISWRDYLLEPIPSADILEWRATVAFAPKRGTHPLLGFAGFLQFFDATFSGEHEEVTLTPNTLLPSHAPTTALP